jgi:hypothetical protein
MCQSDDAYHIIKLSRIYFPKCPSFPVVQSYAPNIDVAVTDQKSKELPLVVSAKPSNGSMLICLSCQRPEISHTGDTKKITTMTRCVYTRTSDHGSQDILSISVVAYKSEITQNFVFIQ